MIHFISDLIKSGTANGASRLYAIPVPKPNEDWPNSMKRSSESVIAAILRWTIFRSETINRSTVCS